MPGDQVYDQRDYLVHPPLAHGMGTTSSYAQQMGWTCPRCRAIWAPHVSRCSCSGPTSPPMAVDNGYRPRLGPGVAESPALTGRLKSLFPGVALHFQPGGSMERAPCFNGDPHHQSAGFPFSGASSMYAGTPIHDVPELPAMQQQDVRVTRYDLQAALDYCGPETHGEEVR